MQLHKKSNLALIAGHVVECFDNTIYGFFAVMLAPVFFSAESNASAILMSYGGFAAGFLARPLGALLLGSLGDKYGRKNPLLWSMVLVGIPTALIGLIPPYERWGLLSSGILILCRLAQGFFYGVEFTGINLYNLEKPPKAGIGQQTGIIIASGVFGGVLATALGAFVTMESMPEWAWRIPFLCGGIAAFTVYILRRRIAETEEFELARRQQELTSFPLKMVFLNHKLSLCLGILISGLTVMPLYFCTIYANKLFQDLGYSVSKSMLLNLSAMVFDGLLIILAGRLADKIGFYRQMLLGSVLVTLAALPAFIIISYSGITTLDVYLFIALLTAVGTVINGCAAPFVGSFFPTNCRYTGTSMSLTIGGALLGGTTPLVGSLLTQWSGATIAPGFWLMFIALLTGTGVWIRQRRLEARKAAAVVSPPFEDKPVRSRVVNE